ncbi:methionine--tRNA ligase [Candidatus Bathyarchaeota archaeon]|nr:MAG: methionine--tRNA ligase [Candidatus Bathyarchaeota archaeon]
MGRWLVTSAWPYINYVPHLGTIIGSALSADVVARYLRLKGEEVVFVSGSDEHGTPIELEAIKKGIHPKKLTDENHAKVKKLFEDWGISYDNYTRTENPIHVRFVQDFFMKIYKNGYIFTQETEFPFCPKCNRFLPDRFIQGECPRCGFSQARGDQCDQCGWPLEPLKLINPQCAICGEKPIIKKTKHWYFDLPKLTDKIKKYIEENDKLPANAKNFSLSLIREGLKPRPITRDNQWGIPAPFPGAEGKTIYVWVEAVLGYISATIEYFEKLGKPEKWEDYWFNHETKTLYFIGKDNIPFHTIILPALLLASGEDYNLPWTVNSTEFLLFKGQKFSKSRRVGVWIDEALKLYPADYWRYTLISIRPEVRDTSFTWEVFIEKVNSDLNDTLGNFIHRTLTFIHRYYDSRIPQPEKLDEYDKDVLENILKFKVELEDSMENFKLQNFILTTINLARLANKYINDKEPWKIVKENPEKAASTLWVATQIVKALATFLQPIIPQTSNKIWETLGLKNKSIQQWNGIIEKIKAGHKINKPKPLFKKVTLPETE